MVDDGVSGAVKLIVESSRKGSTYKCFMEGYSHMFQDKHMSSNLQGALVLSGGFLTRPFLSRSESILDSVSHVPSVVHH
jgi:hypothetical protein